MNMQLKVSRLAKFATFATMMIGAAAVATPASAVPITVGGITFGLGSNLKTSTIWETLSGGPGGTLTGIGRVDTIDSPDCAGVCWQNGNGGLQLTFVFTYHTIVDAPSFPPGTHYFAFGSGSANFYVHNSVGGPLTTGTLAQNVASVTTGGTDWLDLLGHLNEDAPGVPGSQLSGTYHLVSGLPNGQGGGYLDVDTLGAGLANAYFDTNTFPVEGVDGNGDPVDNGIADIRLHSSFAKDASGSTFPLSGSADLSEFSTPKRVPEPGSLLLLGTGLLGLAGLRRKRVKA